MFGFQKEKLRTAGAAEIEEMARLIRQRGLTLVSTPQLRQICRDCGVDPNGFTDADVDRLQQRLLDRKR